MKLPKNILDIILSNKTSLGDNPALPPDLDEKFLVFLVGEHYSELLTHFDEVNIKELSNDLSQTITECKEIESANKEALEELCNNVINDLFEIPSDTITIDMQLVDEVDVKQERLVPETSTEYSYENIEDMNNITSEIYKRRILNAIIIGAAMYYAENTDIYEDELSKIDERLIYLYKKIMCINNLLLFHTKQNLSGKHKDGGRVDVYISNEETPVKIQSQGIIFPVLLEETIKGILELAISHGLPSDRRKCEFITSKSDFKLAEIWDQRVGLPLWKRIKDVINEIGYNPIDIGLNFLFMEISSLRPNNFNGVMQEVFANTKSGKSIIKQISDEIYYQKEQDEFDDFMTNMQSNNGYQINDDEFTSDELINDDLCSTSVLDEDF